MGLYKFKVCEVGDLDKLLNFINTYWKKDHTLVRSREILDFQYYNKDENNYTFLLAENQETGEIDGIRGWIRVAQFDSQLAKYDDVWSAVWKVRTDVKNDEIKILGSYLGRYLNRHKGFGTVGISRFSYAMHTALRHTMCSVSQYFILNPNTTEFRIAVVPSNPQKLYCKNSEWNIKEIENVKTLSDDDVPAFYRPLKSVQYFYNRFQLHPVYKYHFFGIYHNDKIKALFAAKYIDIDNSRIIRIVDVLGSIEETGSLYNEFVALMNRVGAEYTDFLCYGISDDVFYRMGFQKLNPDNGQLIIPNYFEPFLQQNIVLNGAHKPADRYTMFKADADQDRPS